MKWFKHSALASLQTPIRSIKEKYGYAGLGIFWCIVEAVYLNEGQLTIGEIKRMFWNKHFTKTKIEDILMGFGCFKFDTMSRVSLSEDSPNVSPSVSPSVNARTYNREDKEKKRKDNITTKPPTVGPVVIDGGDDDIEFKSLVSLKLC